MQDFWGAKVAILFEDKLLVYLRDDFPRIPFPNHWDFAGGGRESDELPFETVQRETFEEFGIKLYPEQVVFEREYSSPPVDRRVWFFLARLPIDAKRDIVFGDEGQEWRLMTFHEYCAHPQRVPHLANRLKEAIKYERG